MALTASTMLPLGTIAPDFALPNVVTGQTVTQASLADRPALLVMFICQHCPYVKHIQPELVRLDQDWGDRIAIVAISANDITTHPQDAPAHLKTMAETLGLRFPVLYDASQAIAKAYTAACTPDFFLFDGDRRLVYRGQLDDSRPGNNQPLDGHDLRAAIAAVVAGEPVAADQKPSIGCNIKWTPGNEPTYFA